MAKFTYDAEVVEAQADTGGGEPLPDGVYEFTIYEAKIGEYGSEANKGKPRLDVTLKIPTDADEYVGRQVWDIIPIFPVWGSGKPAFAFKQFFGKALNLLDDSGELDFDPNDLLGERVKAVISTEKAQEGSQYGPRNRVSRYVSFDEEVKTAEPAVKKAPAKPAPGGKL